MNKQELDLYYENQMKLLKLIEDGDTSGILTTGSPGEDFRELMKFELIVLKDEKLELTDRGKEAIQLGVHIVLDKLKEKIILADLPAPPVTEKKLNRYFILLLLLLILALVIIQQLI